MATSLRSGSQGREPAAGTRDWRRSGLARRVATGWRQLRLGSAFVGFAVASLTVAFVVAPLLRRRAANADEAELSVQRMIGRAFALSASFWQAIGILTLDSRGLAGLAGRAPCIVVANHPTMIDVVLIGSHLTQMDCIVNAGWTAKSPFLATAIKAAGYVLNDGGQSVIDECSRRLAKGRLLVVFPEGTRSPWGSFGKFHRGAAHIALASGAPIVAVTIRCRPRMLGSGRKWHDVGHRKSAFEMRIAGRLDPATYKGEGVSTPIAARRMTEDLLGIFLQETNLADA